MCYQNRRFIVQSSSLRPDRFSWRDKVNRIVFLYRMKLWPLSELLLGYIPVGIILIEFTLYSQPNIAAHFYKHFKSSARSAYANASFAAQYDTNIPSKIGRIALETLDDVLRQATGLNLSQEISHQILVVSPGDLRHEVEVSIPTRYLYEMVRDALSDRTLEAAARLYGIFIRNRCTRTSASHMLEDGIHNIFRRVASYPHSCKRPRSEMYILEVT
jgi:hypothetical protein